MTTMTSMAGQLVVNTVRIMRTYVGQSGTVRDVTAPASWTALMDRLTSFDVTAWADTNGTDGVDVACESQRGPRGALAVHSMACNFGALAVVR